MSIKQISIFLENRHGSLAEALDLLGKNHIDLIALSVADTTDFGILRAIGSDQEKTLQIAKENGYTASLTDVLAAAVPDSPGGLAGALQQLQKEGVSIEYIYSLVRRINQQAVIILKVSEPAAAERVLAQNGYSLLTLPEIVASCSG